MKMRYDALSKRPRTLRSLTGLNADEFEALLSSFGDAWDSFVTETFERANRKRAYGAGRRAHLKTLEDKLLFILFYYRQYPTQEVQGFLFGMSQAQANEWIHRLSDLLNRALGYEMHLPERRAVRSSVSESTTSPVSAIRELFASCFISTVLQGLSISGCSNV